MRFVAIGVQYRLSSFFCSSLLGLRSYSSRTIYFDDLPLVFFLLIPIKHFTSLPRHLSKKALLNFFVTISSNLSRSVGSVGRSCHKLCFWIVSKQAYCKKPSSNRRRSRFNLWESSCCNLLALSLYLQTTIRKLSFTCIC